MADALQSDQDVGLGTAEGLQSDADVGLQSDADVGIVEKSWWERGQVKPTALTMDPSVRTGPYVEGVLKAFGHGFAEGFGPDRLGVSPETEKTLQGWGLFRSGEGDRFNPLKAMNEVLTHAIIATPELAYRFGGGLLRAGQAAAVEAGLPRDIAALPEAFFGTPHPLGIPQGLPTVKVRAESATETIVSAAIRSPDGRVFSAQTHGHASFLAEDAGADISKISNKDSDGFVTSTGRFVSREEATKIAKRADQMDQSAAQIESDSFTKPAGPSFTAEVSGPERIMAAAYEYKGKVYTGVVHANAMDAAAKDLGVPWDTLIPELGEKHPERQGFVTSTGRFVSREEALKIAKNADQYPSHAPQDATRLSGEYVERGGIQAFHGSPHDFTAFDLSKIGTGEGAQSFGHGLYFAENKAVAGQYAAKLSGGDAASLASQMLQEFKTREAAIAHIERAANRYKDEPVQKEAASLLRNPDWEPPSQLYQVRINANKEHFLDWDRPLSEQPAGVREKLAKAFPDEPYQFEWTYKSRDSGSAWLLHERGETLKPMDGGLAVIEPKGKDGFRVQSDALDRIVPTFEEAQRLAEQKVGQIKKAFPHHDPKGNDIVERLSSNLGSGGASAALREAGIPGIKYLDQGSRFRPPSRIVELAGGRFATESASGKLSPGGSFATRAEAQAHIDANSAGMTSNYVVFDDKLVEITHKNGEPLPDLAQARDLGVIGPERPSINEGAPKEAAAMAAEQKRPETIKSEPLDSWQQRFEHFVTKLDTADDVKQLIRDAARENNDFMPARQGDIPLQHVEAVAQAAGVEPSEINTRGLGRTLRNDAEVRVAMQAMLQLTDNVKTAARDVKTDGSPESLIKLQEAIMRRDLAVEQVVGLRAEWGRTGNVLQEFMRDVKDQDALNTFLKDKGRTPSDLHEIAHAIDQLDRTGAAKALSDARTNPPGWFYWTWVQGLISGLLTHTKYFAANGLYAGIERGVTTPIASIIGKLKETAGSQAERVYFGEMAASMYGMFAAVPNAAIVTAKSIKAGLRAPLESEIALRDAAIARGEPVPKFLERAVNPLTLQGRPTGKFMRIPFTDIGFAEDGAVTRIAGRVLGAPGDAAMGIHTFFKVMGERAGIEQGAYHAAAKEGLSPADAQFWTRRAEIAANPGDAILKEAVEGAYKGTFMQELGPRAKRWQAAAKNDPIGKWVFPFLHIPVNIVKSVYEHTPLALLDKDMRADILGQNGGVKQDMAIARTVVGSSIMGYFVNAALNGRATGDYPRDPKERDKWKLEGKQPNSILIGDHWVSFNRFGPAGSLANLGANIGYVIPHLTSDDDEAMTKATWHGVNAAARVIMDEAGFLSLAMIFEAIHDEKKGTAWVASQASSLVPFSSFVSQTASGGLPFTGGAGGDPYMREAKTFIDGIKYRIPFARETLLPKRDWSGQPIDNPQYGNILRQRQVNTNPVDLEMARLGIHPAPPQDRIGGVKLPPAMYDRYQTVAGAFTRTTLDNIVAQPGWSDLPAFVREDIFHKTIAATRQGAAATMQARYPQIIQQGVQNRLDHINGVKPTKLKEAAE